MVITPTPQADSLVRITAPYDRRRDGGQEGEMSDILGSILTPVVVLVVGLTSIIVALHLVCQ